MREAKKEFGKSLFNLANMLLVIYLLGNYISQFRVNFFIVFLILYTVLGLYFVGFYLIKEGSDE